MNKLKFAVLALSIASGLGAAGFASAAPITGIEGIDECTSSVDVAATYKDIKVRGQVVGQELVSPGYTAERVWTWSGASDCGTHAGGNISDSDVSALFAPLDFVANGEITSSVLNSWLTVDFSEAGGFGSKPSGGNWNLGGGFWDSFAQAAISIHVGNGNPGALDEHGVFLLTPGTFSGDWYFYQTNATGGGISNFKLWTIAKPPGGSDPFPTPTPTPEPATLLMLGTALVGLGLRGRKSKA